jgi:large subunit ribosomal protein L6
MSKIGKVPVPVPAGVTVSLQGQKVSAKGPKGELHYTVAEDVEVTQDGNVFKFAPRVETKQARANWGTSRAQVRNIFTGVKDGFEKKMEITGVGYKAAIAGKNLQLSLGYSHEVNYAIPAGVTITTPKPTEIVVAGADRRQVGQVAAEIREWRGPEPYKGKGIKYANEFIFRKEGKNKK